MTSVRRGNSALITSDTSGSSLSSRDELLQVRRVRPHEKRSCRDVDHFPPVVHPTEQFDGGGLTGEGWDPPRQAP